MRLELGAVGQVNRLRGDVVDRGVAVIGRRTAEHRVLLGVGAMRRSRWHRPKRRPAANRATAACPRTSRPSMARRRSTSPPPWRVRHISDRIGRRLCGGLCLGGLVRRPRWRRDIASRRVEPRPSSALPQLSRRDGLWRVRELRRINRLRSLGKLGRSTGGGASATRDGSPCGAAAANRSLNIIEADATSGCESTWAGRQRREHVVERRPRRTAPQPRPAA